MKNYIKKNDVLTMVKSTLEWNKELYMESDFERLLNQSYGFVMGVTQVRPELYEEITAIWENFRFDCRAEHLQAVRLGTYSGK